MRVIVLASMVASLGIAACSNQSQQAEADALSRVFQLELIGANLQALEKLAGGPPLEISPDGGTRTYRVDGCLVSVGVAGEGEQWSVASLRLQISPACDVDVSSFLSVEPGARVPTASEMTFGAFREVVGGASVFYADCLASCGNAYDPSVYQHWAGPRSLDFIEVMIEATLSGNEAVDAGSKWREAMIGREGEDWVVEGGFNCSPEKYSAIAHQAFAFVRPHAITVGRELSLPRCDVAVAPASGSAGTVIVPKPASECDYDYGKALERSGLVARETSVHGPEDEDFPGYGCPYRITPAPGSVVPAGGAVAFRRAWEGS